MARCVTEANEGLRGELEEERGRYQGLLKEFTRLEQRYENLREMSVLAEVGGQWTVCNGGGVLIYVKGISSALKLMSPAI